MAFVMNTLVGNSASSPTMTTGRFKPHLMPGTSSNLEANAEVYGDSDSDFPSFMLFLQFSSPHFV